MNRLALGVPVLLALAVLPLHAGGKKPDPAFAAVKDDPKLPRVLLIGDSISIGYTVPVQEMLQGKANVHRIPENGGPTTNGLKKIERWLGQEPWDVIHFNWGLHDLKRDAQGQHQVPLEQYEKNLAALVQKMKGRAKVLIWCSTTPVPEGKVSPPRRPGDVIAYNKAASKVMRDNGIPTDDLYTFALPRLQEIQRPVNVHFTAAGSRLLARQVAGSIAKALSGKAAP